MAKGLGALALAAFAPKPKETEAQRRARISESSKSRAIRVEHLSSYGQGKTRDHRPGLVPMLT